jgi:aminoglycoside phosphotransferase
MNPSSLSAHTQQELSKLNLETLNVLQTIVNQTPPISLIDFFRNQGDKYTRALRIIRPDDDIPDVGTSPHSSYISTPSKPSFSKKLVRPEVIALVEKINHRCVNDLEEKNVLCRQYQHVTTQHLMSLIPGGEVIWRLFSQSVTKVDDNLVVKCGRADVVKLEEAANIQQIRQLTSIPVPEVVRVNADAHKIYIFMSYIPGTPLQEIWPAMTSNATEHITTQLKIYMNELRSVSAPSPAYFGSHESHTCIDSRVLTRTNIGQNSLISSEAEFNKFIMKDLKTVYHDEYYNMLLSMMRCDHKLVLTHGDFHPRNILIKDNVVVGIIDWEFAGWYPEHWEYLKALVAVGPVVDWWRYLPNIVGSYTEEWALDRQVQYVMKMR